MLKRSLEKGATVGRLKITQRTAFYRAGNYVSGPEIMFQGRKFYPRAGISASGQNFRGPEIP
jgi:hypothetical protein